MTKAYACSHVKALTAFILLTFLIIVPYSNTFHAAWQFDDKPNIVENQRLHIPDLSPSSLWRTFFAEAGKEAFYRPIPSLTLAINWYVGRGDTFGFHLVNILIHVLTAFVLFLTSVLLLQTPKIKQHYNGEDVYFISLLCAALWALNPIQTQAVTYIVQRMASMAALFSITGIYFYLNARFCISRKTKTWLYAACLSSCFLAMMSKQNAVLVVPSIILLELVFFQNLSVLKRKIRDCHPWPAAMGLLFLFLCALAVFLGTSNFITANYETRTFTAVQRLLTEPRILIFYISQIFYPLPSRLSITHDIIVSSALFKPWTTLPSILAILLMIGVSLHQARKWPLVCFAVLFFFLNHLVESTFLPLELIFEHRNYLPTLFMFLPIACGLRSMFNFYRSRSRFMAVLIAGFTVLLLIGLGNFTFIRNHAWKTETTLWQDAMQKAPQDARPVVNLAIQFAWAENPTPLQLDVALAMFKKAMSLNMARNFLVTDIINNIGIVYYKMGDYEKAVESYRKGLELDPGFLKMRYDLISSLVMLGQWEAAGREADLLLENPKGYLEPGYFNLKGFILLWQIQPQAALGYFQKALAMEPGNTAALLNMGIALSLTGEFANADRCLRQVAALAKGDIWPYYALVENSARAGDHAKAESYAQRMLDTFPVQAAISGIEWYADSHKTVPVSADIIMPVLSETLAGSARELEKYSSANPGK